MGNRCNANAALVFEFIYRFISISKSYFGKVDEEAVKSNFVLIYELLDGKWFAIHNWFDTTVLTWLLLPTTFYRDPRLWVSSEFGDRYIEDVHHHRRYQVGNGRCKYIGRFIEESFGSRRSLGGFYQREDSSRITIQATGATSWRRADVKYRKNEAFVDVIESVNLLMSKEGEFTKVYSDHLRNPPCSNLAFASRCRTTRWRRRSDHDACLSEWNAGVQIRS
jgi:AP-2 complex subunit mu-1